jgi:hypothetical protein
VRFMLKAAADRRQDIEQWQKEITKATAVGDFYLVIRLRSRISENRSEKMLNRWSRL